MCLCFEIKLCKLIDIYKVNTLDVKIGIIKLMHWLGFDPRTSRIQIENHTSTPPLLAYFTEF